MMASRLMHRREHVIPALTDHLEDEGGVIGPQIDGRVGGFFSSLLGLFNAPRLFTRFFGSLCWNGNSPWQGVGLNCQFH